VFWLPIDSATQHAAYRADQLAAMDEAVPSNWQDSIALGRGSPGAASSRPAVATPHAGLTLAAAHGQCGTAVATARTRRSHGPGGFITAYEAVRERIAVQRGLLHRTPSTCTGHGGGNDIAYTPFVYGTAPMGSRTSAAVSFADSPGRVAHFHAGSVLGGTGLAVSRRSRHKAAAFSTSSALPRATRVRR